MTETNIKGTKMIDTPARPAPLSPDQYHTRQDIRDHHKAEQSYHDHQREVARQLQVAADNERSKALVEASREQTDAEYDDLKRKQWNESRDKQAATLAKEHADALEKTAFLLSSPPVVDLFARTDYSFLKDYEHWARRGYTLEADGIRLFQPGFYSVQLTAPAAAKKAKN